MDGAQKTVAYAYDPVGNRSRVTDPDGGAFTYAYDANNQLTEVQNPQNDRTSFSYDAIGRRTLKLLANGTKATFLYDAAGQVTRVANLKSDDSTISQFDYQYDPAGNKIRIATAAGGLTTCAYDKTYQLAEEWKTATGLGWSGLSADDWGDMTAGGWSGLQVNSPPAYHHTYSWDPTGNRVLEIRDGARTTSTFDAANQNVDSVNAAGRTTYTFDASGNRTGVEKPDGSRTTTTYDYENRDLQVQLPTGIRNTMAYDPDGLRVLLQDSKGTTRFVYDSQQYLLETDGSNVITAVYSQEPGSYSNLNSQYRYNGSLWIPSYHHYDSLGSTMELTDADQGITDTYQYDAFGSLVSRTGETVNPFQWLGRVGYYLVSDTGLVYVIMRTYDPVAGVWTTLDLLRFVNGMNMYKAWFVPNRIDSSGLQTQSCCGSQLYDPTQQCCDNNQIASKVSVYVVIRNGPRLQNITDGHTDLVIPGTGGGMVGYFGTGQGFGPGGGFGMAGFVNNTVDEWYRGPAARPKYGQGPQGQVLSTICRIRVCPGEAAKMAAATSAINDNPGTFNIIGNNCTTNACSILRSGNAWGAPASGIESPSEVKNTLENQPGVECFSGYTAFGRSTAAGIEVEIWNTNNPKSPTDIVVYTN